MLFVVGALASSDKENEGGTKVKRAYSLGYAATPITYDHDVIAHAPIASTHYVHHAPVISHAPLTAAVHPIYPAVHAPLAKASFVSTSVQHFPSASYIAAAHTPIVSSAYIAHQPVYASLPLLTEFHRR